MAKAKKSPETVPPLVVAPPPPKAVEPGAVALVLQTPSKKRPLEGAGHLGARDTRGTSTRGEMRKVEKRIDAPRKTGRPAERSGQQRSHKHVAPIVAVKARRK